MAKTKTSISDFELSGNTRFAKPANFSDDGDADDLDNDDLLDDEDDLPADDDIADDDDQDDADADTDDVDDDADSDDADDDNDDEFSYSALVNDLVEEGVVVLDETKEYDDTPEGFREIIKDSATAVMHSTIEKLPATAQRIMQLALKGATEDDLQSLLVLEDGPDWAEADLDEEDVQRAAVEEALRIREPELTDEEISERVLDLEDLGKLRKQAERDQKFLQKHQDKLKDEVEAQVVARTKEQEKAYETQVTNIRNYIAEQKEVAGIPLTKKDREDFMAYLTVKDKDGLTQADKMNTPERRIHKEFLNFKNFNLGKLKREAVTEATKAVKKELGRYNSGRSRGNQGQRPSGPTGIETARIVSPSSFLSAFNTEE